MGYHLARRQHLFEMTVPVLKRESENTHRSAPQQISASARLD